MVVVFKVASQITIDDRVTRLRHLGVTRGRQDGSLPRPYHPGIKTKALECRTTRQMFRIRRMVAKVTIRHVARGEDEYLAEQVPAVRSASTQEQETAVSFGCHGKRQRNKGSRRLVASGIIIITPWKGRGKEDE